MYNFSTLFYLHFKKLSFWSTTLMSAPKNLPNVNVQLIKIPCRLRNTLQPHSCCEQSRGSRGPFVPCVALPTKVELYSKEASPRDGWVLHPMNETKHILE